MKEETADNFTWLSIAQAKKNYILFKNLKEIREENLLNIDGINNKIGSIKFQLLHKHSNEYEIKVFYK